MCSKTGSYAPSIKSIRSMLGGELMDFGLAMEAIMFLYALDSPLIQRREVEDTTTIDGKASI